MWDEVYGGPVLVEEEKEGRGRRRLAGSKYDYSTIRIAFPNEKMTMSNIPCLWSTFTKALLFFDAESKMEHYGGQNALPLPK